MKKGNQRATDWYIKQTETHQYLHASLCYISHCKKSLPFSQALCLNKICSENAFFDKRCNALEAWLKEQGYSGKLLKGQILKFRKCSTSEVLSERKRVGNNAWFGFNITYHPVLSKLKNVLSEVHLLLTPDRQHEKVSEKMPIVRFRRAKSLKDILVRAKGASLGKKKDCCRSCRGNRCKICKVVVTTETFRFWSTEIEYRFKTDNLNCRSNNVVYFFSCKASSKQYTGSTKNFRSRFNNYKSSHRCFIKKNTVKQASFYGHFEIDKITVWVIGKLPSMTEQRV